MRKIITFLGKYLKETTYRYQGKEYKGKIFSQALREFIIDFDQMLVFVTSEAEKTTWPVLQELHDSRILPVRIPIGKDSEGLWNLFDLLIENVDQEDSLIFDITHGLRSIPFLVFLAAAYLKVARNVTIEAILYGAYELGQPAPVIDLSEFVSLLDWLTATNQFIYTGDARYLASRLSKVGNARHLPSVKKAGEQLETLSLAMMLCRPIEVMKEAGNLSMALEQAGEELREWARPFNLLAQRIQDEYQNRSVADPQHDVESGMEQQYRLIIWYLENNQIIQAVTLAREWVVTGVGWRQKNQFFQDKDDRVPIEEQLGALSSKDDTESAQQELLASGLSRDEVERLRKLWSHLTDVRNDLDHAGMRRGKKSAQQLAGEAKKSLRKKIVYLAKLWKLEE